jgi:hypothetical protein
VAATRLEELRRLEAALEAGWAELQRGGHGFSGLQATLSQEELTPEARAQALRETNQAQLGFLSRLDDFQRRMQVHFMEQVVAELEHAVESMCEFYGPKRITRVRREHRQLAKLAQRYRDLEHLYGSADDHQRIAVYQRFYTGVVAFSRRIRRLDPTMPEPLPPGLVDLATRARRSLAWRLKRIPAVLRMLWAALRLALSVLSKKDPETGTPFTRRVDAFFQAWGAVKGYRVEITGNEQLFEPATATTVTLYAPAHRQGTTDNVTFSHLALPDYCVFNAVDQLPLLPRFLKDRIAGTRVLIAVGGGRGPSVERAIEALTRGDSRNVLIYPEGSVSEGFRGTHPPRRNFGESLVRRLREAGFEVRIVPVTYLDNARFLDLPPVSAAPEERRLRVVVSLPLEGAAVDTLLQAGGGEMVNRALRLAWLETLVTDEQQFLGHDRVRAVEARLDLELDGIRYWGSLESVPVRDRLETRADQPIGVREEPFHGKRVRVLEIPESAREPDDKIVLPDLASPDSRELLIGIRAPSHIYLNVGHRRFDGDIFRPLRVRDRDYVYPGIVIRLMGVPVKSVNAIARKLDEISGREYRTLTCANSACQVIARAANIRIDDHADLRPFLPSHALPTRTIRKLIERGVRNHQGERIETQIYKTDARSLDEILAAMRSEEIRIARDHLAVISVGLGRRLASGARAIGARALSIARPGRGV